MEVDTLVFLIIQVVVVSFVDAVEFDDDIGERIYKETTDLCSLLRKF